MKQLFKLIIFAALAVSCSEKQPDILEEITDGLRGKYQLKSFTYLGEPVDLDDDGVCSNDIIAEMERYSNTDNVLSYPLIIYPVNEYDCRKSIYIHIPKQSIEFNKWTGKYDNLSFTGNGMCIYFSYHIDHNGNIVTEVHNEKNEPTCEDWDDLIYRIDYKDTYGIKITKFGNNVLEVLINYSLYDYKTDKLVNDNAVLVYERFSYSVR